MDNQVKVICDNIVEDRKLLRNKMLWEIDSNATAIMSAFLYASKGKRADIDKYVKCKKLLKKKASIFSEFRGIAFTLVITKMTLAEDPEKYLTEALEVYKKLRERHKLTASANMVMAALTIYENGGLAKADENIEKLDDIYKKLRKEHPLLICDEDRGYLAMIVASGANTDLIIEEIEACYEANKKVYVFKNAVHTLAQVLALNSCSVDKKSEKVKDLIKGFKAAKKPINKEFGLGAIGALTLLDMSSDEIVAKVAEVDDYLKHQKGFRWYSTSARIRRMYAQLIVMISYLPEDTSMLTSMISSTLAMVLIEEIIMMIIVMETASAAARSSSSASAAN